MNKPYEYQSDFARKYIALGRAGSEAEDVFGDAPPTLLSDLAGKYIALGRAQVEAEIRAEAEARLLLKLLRFKGFTVSPELSARVESCQDLDQLELWAERVLTATALDDIFAAR